MTTSARLRCAVTKSASAGPAGRAADGDTARQARRAERLHKRLGGECCAERLQGDVTVACRVGLHADSALITAVT